MKSILGLIVAYSLFVIFSSTSFAGNLQVQDPQQAWRKDYGTIDEAVLDIKPAGIYAEYGLTLTFSARGTSFTNVYDTLEVQYTFELPQTAMITDSWLWVGDTIVKAKLIDRGQASLIYEGIVKRRRDPSILYKNSQTNYEFRIFPMAGTVPRKAKITWLQPMDWSKATVTMPLPVSMFSVSKIKLPALKVNVYDDNTFKNPVFSNLKTLTFTKETQGDGSTISIASIPGTNLTSGQSILMDSPLRNGFFLSYFENTFNDGFYQMVLIPKEALAFDNNKKMVILVDYDASKTGIAKDDLFGFIQTAILTNLTAKDSFNLILSGIAPTLVKDNWIAADAQSVNALFATLNKDKLATYTNLPQLLLKGVEYVKSKGYGSSILLIASSDALGSNKTANPVIEEMQKAMETNIIFNIVDFCSYKTTYSMGGKYFYGNEYLYSYLSKSSGGVYFDNDKLGKGLLNSINTTMQSMDGEVKSFELYPSLENGFCYAKYTPTSSILPSYSNTPVIQIGRYFGEFPFKVRATGFLANKAFSKEISITQNEMNESTHNLMSAWYGNYIKGLELSQQTNDIVKEIISTSMDNRVLSIYTAFLALEPGYKDPNDDDDTHVTEVIETSSGNASISASPNPFTDKLNISFDVKEGVLINSVQVFDIMGNIVKSFSLSGEDTNLRTLSWDGKDESGSDLSDGFYFIVLNTSSGRIMCKVILRR